MARDPRRGGREWSGGIQVQPGGSTRKQSDFFGLGGNPPFVAHTPELLQRGTIPHLFCCIGCPPSVLKRCGQKVVVPDYPPNLAGGKSACPIGQRRNRGIGAWPLADHKSGVQPGGTQGHTGLGRGVPSLAAPYVPDPHALRPRTRYQRKNPSGGKVSSVVIAGTSPDCRQIAGDSAPG